MEDNPPRMSIVTQQSVAYEKKILSQKMRREMTPAETILWEQLRAKRLGVHFRRQQVIAGFIADFYCHSASLVIEVDGEIHQDKAHKEYDREREQIFQELGLNVLRVTNYSIKNELQAFLEIVHQRIAPISSSSL